MTPDSVLIDKLPRGQSLSRYTAARLGGPADFLHVARHADFRDTLPILREAWEKALPVTILGGGANVLISDKGIRGLTIINRAAQLSHTIDRDMAKVIASSGTNLIRLSRYCQEHGISGMAWAIAVPGTVGGAVVNNAGAHGGDMAGTLRRAQIVDAEAGALWLSRDDLQYDYRHSSLKSDSARRFFVTRAEFRLRRDDPAAIQARMDAYSAARKRTQPAGASLGSIFKNPPGDYAGRLIDAAGLKGARIGDVQVSPVHANFFVNMGGAGAGDYLRLIRHVQATVHDAFGIELELEIQLLGEW